ncbi:MAG: hypothetical protein JEZ00_22280 [Anaerolineaceae bacterium]|nr:hypothetical protein [Anaerolineaceae bacterium]
MAENPIRFVQCPYCKKKFGVRRDQIVDFCFFCGGTINLQPKIRTPLAALALIGKATQFVGAFVQERVQEARQPKVEAESEGVLSPFTEELPLLAEDEELFDPVAIDETDVRPLKERLIQEPVAEEEFDAMALIETDLLDNDPVFPDKVENPFDPMALIETDLLDDDPVFPDKVEKPFDPMALIETDLLDENPVFPEQVGNPFEPVEFLDAEPFEDDALKEEQKPAGPAKVFDPIDLLRPDADDIPEYQEPELIEEQTPFFTRQRIIIFAAVTGGIVLILIWIFIWLSLG